MEKDLTVGNPIISLIKYTLPLLGSIIFQQLYSIADSLIVGRYLGTDALAAVGNSFEITAVFIAIAFGCNIGTSVVTARYFGQKKYTDLKTTVFTSFIVSSIIAIVFTLLGWFFSKPLLQLIKTPNSILNDSLNYLLIYIGGYIFLLLYNISTGVFSALGDSKTPFIFLAISSVANVIMDIVFVKYCNMGVPGVAWATLLCQGLSGIVAFVTALYRIKRIKTEQKAKLFELSKLKELSIIAIPSIMQQGFVSVGNIVIQGFINGFGTSAIGGFTAAFKLNGMVVTSLNALGSGMSNYSAQNYGAKKSDRIKKGFYSGFAVAFCLALVFMILFLLCSEKLITIFIVDGNVEAIDIGSKFLYIVSPFYCFITIKLISDGILRGVGKMTLFVITTMTDLIIRVVLSAILSKSIGITGIWYAWPIGWVIATIMSFVFYQIVKKKNYGIIVSQEDELI